MDYAPALTGEAGQCRDDDRDRGGTAGQVGQGSLDPVPCPGSKSAGARDEKMIIANDDALPFDEGLGRTGFARCLFLLRFRRLRLSQRAFAARYGLGYPTIRDLEQGVTQPTPAMRLIVAAIARDPGGMEEAAKMASKGAPAEGR